MSTRNTLKFHFEEGGGGFRLYRECFPVDEEFVYLEVYGVPFETASSTNLSGTGPNSVAMRLPEEWARKLGLVSKGKTRTRNQKTENVQP